MEKEELIINERALARRSKQKLTSLKENTIFVVSQYCKGCAQCVEACPTGTLQLYDKTESKWGVAVGAEQTEYCTGCKTCEMKCPDFAIFVV